MRSILIFFFLLPLAAEPHSPSVKAKLKEAKKAEKAKDFATEKRLYEEALREEPQSVELLQSVAWAAQQECRWADGLELLQQARGLTREKKRLQKIEEHMAFLETARLYASPEVYCGSPYLLKKPVPIKQVSPVTPRGSDMPPGVVKVLVWAEVGPDGMPSNLKVPPLGNIGLLAGYALSAAAQWRFQPATLDGKPVRVAAFIGFHFGADR